MATIRKLPSGKFNVQVRRAGYPPLSDTFAAKATKTIAFMHAGCTGPYQIGDK